MRLSESDQYTSLVRKLTILYSFSELAGAILRVLLSRLCAVSCHLSLLRLTAEIMVASDNASFFSCQLASTIARRVQIVCVPPTSVKYSPEKFITLIDMIIAI